LFIQNLGAKRRFTTQTIERDRAPNCPKNPTADRPIVPYIAGMVKLTKSNSVAALVDAVPTFGATHRSVLHRPHQQGDWGHLSPEPLRNRGPAFRGFCRRARRAYRSPIHAIVAVAPKRTHNTASAWEGRPVSPGMATPFPGTGRVTAGTVITGERMRRGPAA
jgi:hypothetical protein